MSGDVLTAECREALEAVDLSRLCHRRIRIAASAVIVDGGFVSMAGTVVSMPRAARFERNRRGDTVTFYVCCVTGYGECERTMLTRLVYKASNEEDIWAHQCQPYGQAF